MGERDAKELRSEFEFPPHTKVRVVTTVDRKLCQEMELIHTREIERARAEDRTEPDWSNTIEILLRKGARDYRTKILSSKLNPNVLARLDDFAVNHLLQQMVSLLFSLTYLHSLSARTIIN